MTRYMAVVSYLGTAYSGFQRQPDEPTVQGRLDEALSTLNGGPVATSGAGRTDAGVHAAGQVVAFDVDLSIDGPAWLRSLNGLTPGDISVLSLGEVPASFDPRRDALWREYRYFVLNRRWPSPALAGITHHVSKPIDLSAAGRACSALEGTHDFSSFTLASSSGSRIREVTLCRIEPVGFVDGLLCFTVRATAFLYRMVRLLAGAVAGVGTGAMDLSLLEECVTSPRSEPCAVPLPAEGLFFWKVEYPPEAVTALPHST